MELECDVFFPTKEPNFPISKKERLDCLVAKVHSKLKKSSVKGGSVFRGAPRAPELVPSWCDLAETPLTALVLCLPLGPKSTGCHGDSER